MSDRSAIEWTDATMNRRVRLLFVFRFFRWYIAAGSNGSGYTHIIWGRVGE